MRYRSNLVSPELAHHFKLLNPPIQILGHDIPSDPDHEPNCGFFSEDEAAILYHIAKSIPGAWLDIGARFGWTAAHLIEAGCRVTAVDPALDYAVLQGRFESNLQSHWDGIVAVYHETAAQFFQRKGARFVGAVIDGNHDDPEPKNDVRGFLRMVDGQEDCTVILHDFYGQPIIDAVQFLMDEGFSTRIYWTPNGVALCWRGLRDFVPPFHVRDPAICWKDVRRPLKGFDFEKCL